MAREELCIFSRHEFLICAQNVFLITSALCICNDYTAADDSGLGRSQSSSSKLAAAGKQPAGTTVDDSVVLQSTLSESFSRTVKDWERVRQSRGSKTRGGTSTAVAAVPSPQPSAVVGTTSRKPSSVTSAAAATDSRSKSHDRDKSRQRAEKELGKLIKKERKLEEEMRRVAVARSERMKTSLLHVAAYSCITYRILPKKQNKKIELMLTGRAKSYSSLCSQTVSLSPAISSRLFYGGTAL